MFEREGNDLLLEGLRHLIKYWFHYDPSILQGLKGTQPNYWCNHTPFVLKFKFMCLNQLILVFLIVLLLVAGKLNIGCAREYNVIEKPERENSTFGFLGFIFATFILYPTPPFYFYLCPFEYITYQDDLRHENVYTCKFKDQVKADQCLLWFH